MVTVSEVGKWMHRNRKQLFAAIAILWISLFLSLVYYGSIRYLYVSPFVSIEWYSRDFQGLVSAGKYDAVAESASTAQYFSLYTDPITFGVGFQYSNQFLKEKIVFFQVMNETGIFYMKDFPWEKMPSDRIIDYWIQGFKASPEKEVFSVCYRFKSGAVLQVADLYEIYGKPADAMHPHRYRVVRMFFVGTKYKKYFPHAYFETEANIRHYKQLMKEDKGWVRQANRYINEKEVKEEEPVLDYRTNPDYYKPLSQRGK